MKRFSTHCMDELEDKTKKNRNEKKSKPSRQTLDFLSQFARSYRVEPALQSEFCGHVMN
ncbi:MAG: hypothetical protein LUD46_06930 [Parabacteroides sp.]|nr:hypothetical protein [Parabacteroides sp.]